MTVFLVVLKKQIRTTRPTPDEALDRRFYLSDEEARQARREAGHTWFTADIVPAILQWENDFYG